MNNKAAFQNQTDSFIMNIPPKGILYGRRMDEYFFESDLPEKLVPIFYIDTIQWIEKNAIEDFQWKGEFVSDNDYAVVISDKNHQIAYLPSNIHVEILKYTGGDIVHIQYEDSVYLSHKNSIRLVSIPENPLLVQVKSIDGLQVRQVESNHLIHYSFLQSRIVGYIPYNTIIIVSQKSFLPFHRTLPNHDNVRIWNIAGMPNHFIVEQNLFSDPVKNLQLLGYSHMKTEKTIHDYNRSKIFLHSESPFILTKPCLLCWDREAVHSFVHGNTAHQAVCNECIDTFTKHHTKDICPICRQHVDNIIEIF